MAKFNVSNWFEKRAALNIQTFEVEDVLFELMALTVDQIEHIRGLDKYDEIVSDAADMGISYNRKRVFDDKELSKDLDLLWGVEELDVDSDPCIKQRVGEKVCDISGLADFLDSILNPVISGDDLPGEGITLGELEEDAAMALSVQ